MVPFFASQASEGRRLSKAAGQEGAAQYLSPQKTLPNRSKNDPLNLLNTVTRFLLLFKKLRYLVAPSTG